MPDVPGEPVPAYLRIAGDLRARIVAGELAPGVKLPSETELMHEYEVSRTVAIWAFAVLRHEGLVERRRGSGTYVRDVTRIVRRGATRDQRGTGPTSPLVRDVTAAGHNATWDHRSEPGTADLLTATRLGIDVGDPVMVTRYVFYADRAPIQMSTSWEPLAVTGGTPIEYPERSGPVGVVARFDSIGVHIDQAVERIHARAAHPLEIESLRLPRRGAYVLVIERTYLAAGRAVETADITLLGDRYVVEYRVPID